MSRTRFFRRCFSLPAVFVALGVVAPGVNAQETPAAGVQREHLVKKGDTLWDLARLYLGNPFLWTVIYEANRPVVNNPHWIYPAEKLIIPGPDTTKATPIGDPVAAVLSIVVEPLVAPEPKDTVPTVLATFDTRRPVVAASEYRSAPWLSQRPDEGILGRIVRVSDPTVASDKIPSTLYPNQQVLLGELRGTAHAGDSLQIVRLGRRLGTAGRVVEPYGVLRVDSVGSTVIAATLVRQFGPAKVGDYVMVLEALPTIPLGEPEEVSTGTEGRILEFLHDEPIYSAGDIAFISLGADQVGIGDELAVYIPQQRIDNERPDVLPAMTVGVVRVVKVNDHSATVRVTGVRNTGLRNGLPARLVRRAP